MKRLMMFVAVIALGPASGPGADENPQAADEAAIRTAVESYVAAFNRSDAKGLAELWSPEAVYMNPISEEQVTGRDAIEQQFSAIFAEAKGAKLEATTHSVKFVSPNVAVEHGTAKVIHADQEPVESDYTAVYVKRDGQWLLDRVTEEDRPVDASHYEQLKDLEWMIGNWVDEDEDARIETTCHWARNQNFMVRWFAVSVRDRVDMAGVQIIGWDPSTQQIRSWVFDSDGGFGEATWRKKDQSWYVHAKGTLSDGRKASSVNIITYVDENTFTFQSVDRQTDGELLPNVDEVVVVRKSASE
jgi:uncharacterized protein (TIGR02246 family)